MSLISERERHLKWGTLDPLEAVLYIGCGASIIGFSVSVLLDVITRQIGHPWLWLQQLTTGSFTYGIFIGMALAARRNEHMYLTEIVQAMHGSKRLTVEVFARLVVLAVAACMVIFGWQNFLLDMGSYRMPSLIPLGYYTIIVPISGALIGLFQVEETPSQALEFAYNALRLAPKRIWIEDDKGVLHTDYEAILAYARKRGSGKS